MKFDRITIEPGKMSGQPCIRGYRFTVSHLLKSLALLKTRAAVLEGYPFVEDEDIDQALAYAAACLPSGIIDLAPETAVSEVGGTSEPTLVGAAR